MEQVNIKKIKELINRQNISQYELAERSGVSQSTISKHLQNGEFGVAELLGIADTLGVPVKDLFKVADKFRLSIDIEDVEFDDADIAAVASNNTLTVLENLGYKAHANIRKVCANEQERLF